MPIAWIADPSARDAAALIRADPTVVRPLVVKRVRAPVAVFLDLLDDLPRAARHVERLGAGRYRIEPAGDGGEVRVDDGAGARARVVRLLGRPTARVYRASGGLKLPAFPEIRGSGLIALRVEAEPVEAGEGPATLVGGQIHFRLESALLHAVARPVARILRAVIDAKVNHLVDAAVAVCEGVAREAEGVRGGPAV